MTPPSAYSGAVAALEDTGRPSDEMSPASVAEVAADAEADVDAEADTGVCT